MNNRSKTSDSNNIAGRFAPSPTGAPHFGTLLAAVASFVHARASGAVWRVRIEDLDQDRIMPGAADQMLHTLEACILHWDGPVVYQSQRNTAYEAALEDLLQRGLAFACGCSRKDLQDAKSGPEGPIYPGTCRQGLPPGRTARSYRLRVTDEDICFDDLVLGCVCQNLAHEVGDFVIRRADGYFAYQLAVVVDDAWQQITQVVRGADLLASTQRQIFLQRQLGLPTPLYLHFPLILGPDGKKLSKSEDSPPVDLRHPERLLHLALSVLGQDPPDGKAEELLAWAVENWRPSAIPAVATLPYSVLSSLT